MLKSGIFITENDSWNIYEIEEPGFYRIDFVRGNAAFNVDYQAVAYSQVRRKQVFTIGDPSIYEQYSMLKAQVEQAQIKMVKNAQWIDGKYVVTNTGDNDKLDCHIQTKSENGNLVESTVKLGSRAITEIVVDPIYGIKLLPLNFNEYQTLSISKDNVNDVQSGQLYYSWDVLRRRYNLSHMFNKDFKVVTNVEEARERLQHWKDHPSMYKGFDTETTGTDVDMYGDDHMVGIIIAEDENTSTYYPFRHKGDWNLPMSFLDELMSVIKSQEDRLIAHNKKFDRKVMLKEGYDIRCKWDTMQISIVLNPIIKKGAHALKTLIEELTHNKFLELDEIFINAKDIDFSVLDPEITKWYACPDATNVITLFKEQMKKLPKWQYKLVTLECDLADVKADMEYYGIRVDTKLYERQYKNCNYILDKLLNAFRTLTKEDGNINSNQVLVPLIYEKMKCKVLMRTKTGQASTSSLAIKKLAGIKSKEPHNITEDLTDLYGNVIIKASTLANAKYPALVILAKYREYNKLKTAFYARFERTMKTGRIFFWVNQNGAATGRQSSPMHQLPPELKEVILADAEDRDFWGPDFSQIELRMIAYLAGEKELIELASDPDNDIHRIIGSLISGKEMWAITKEERSKGKRRNFGVVYLISARGLAGQIFGPGYSDENVEFCQQQLDEFYHKFKRIDRYIKRNAAKVQQQGYMETEWFRRRRLFPEIFDPEIEPRKKASILRMANNVPVQGTAADYLKLAEVQMYNYIREKGWNELKDGFPLVRMMLSIHDEIIISADNSIPYEEIVEMITKCMETPVDGAPPFFVQPARMDNWEGHSDDSVAMPIPLRNKLIEDYHVTGKSVFHNSYFKLIVPDDVQTIINTTEALNVKEFVEKYKDKCTLVFDHGDYVQTADEKHVAEALRRYVQSGFTTYRIDNYLNVLNDYRDGKLHEYMTDLIQKYGTDYKIVGEHVRHPSLTHELINVYSKNMKGKDLTHEESIVEAARLYIEEMLNNNKDKVASIVIPENNLKKVSDKDLFQSQLEATVNFDDQGNVIYYDESDEDDSDYFDDPDPDAIIHQTTEKPIYVWEMGDSLTLDLSDMPNMDLANKVISKVYEAKADDGFFKVNIIYAGKLISAGFNVEHLQVEEWNDFILSLLNKESILC